MVLAWNDRWERVPNSKLGGGQGSSFLATAKDGTEGRFFVKRLRKHKSEEARKRFRREVAAYETLNHLGLPKLVDDNSVEWQNLQVPLYLVLECIEGGTLSERISLVGPMSPEAAIACVVRISGVLEYCHAEGVIHQDLKPSNVMLRGDVEASPVVVDFGLSFNEGGDDVGDVTRVGEEIANRFLRLPEAWGNHNALSDVTQLAGLFFYSLTGLEPHVLLDHNGDMPHRRQGAGQLLRAQFSERQFLRISSLFDRAFQTSSAERFQSASDLRVAVEGLLAPVKDSSDLEGLEAHLDEVLARTNQAAFAATTARLNHFVNAAVAYAGSLATSKGMRHLQQGYAYQPGFVDFALMEMAATKVPPYVRFRFELRGSFDVVLKVAEEEIWTGQSAEDSILADVVQRTLIQSFLIECDEP
jgi:eukaryotic-like serine/threonine-protein kinase